MKVEKISFLLPNLVGGGAERVVVQLANSFSELNLSIDLLLMRKQGELLSEVSSRVNIVDMGLAGMYSGLPKLISYLKNNQPKALLSTLEATSLMSLLARRFSGVNTHVVVRISVAISQHKRHPIKKMMERALLSLIYPWADSLVSVSHDTARDLSKFAGLPLENIQTIYNPVITDDLIRQSMDVAHHSFYEHGAPPVILGVGRLTEQKGFDVLLRAFQFVRKEMPARLLILGEGKDRAALEHAVRLLELDEDVDLPGFVSNPFAYMRAAKVFALSSRWEGLPSVLIQALACGCPVVSTDCPTGPSEILDGGKYGHLVPVGDAEALARAMLESLQGDHRRPPAAWLDQFRVEPVTRQYLNIMGLE